MTATETGVKERIVADLDGLPEEALREVAAFVEYQRYKLERTEDAAPPDKPVALGGLWEGLGLTTEDLDEARREMWSGFGARDL